MQGVGCRVWSSGLGFEGLLGINPKNLFRINPEVRGLGFEFIWDKP